MVTLVVDNKGTPDQFVRLDVCVLIRTRQIRTLPTTPKLSHAYKLAFLICVKSCRRHRYLRLVIIN